MAKRKSRTSSRRPSLRRVDEVFKIQGGRELASLFDLSDALDEISDETFSFHANEEKNDFSNWVENVFELPDLAEGIRGSSREGANLRITRHLLGEMRNK